MPEVKLFIRHYFDLPCMTFPPFFVNYVPHYLFPQDLRFITALDRLSLEDELGFLNSFLYCYLVWRLLPLSSAPFVAEIGRDVVKVWTIGGTGRSF